MEKNVYLQYICIYVYLEIDMMYVYMYMFAYTETYIYIYSVCLSVCIFIQIEIYIYIYVHIYIYSHMLVPLKSAAISRSTGDAHLNSESGSCSFSSTRGVTWSRAQRQEKFLSPPITPNQPNKWGFVSHISRFCVSKLLVQSFLPNLLAGRGVGTPVPPCPTGLFLTS